MPFLDSYLNLLIIQYFNKPKMRASITNLVTEYNALYDFANNFVDAFDVDTGTDARLDVVGRIVGLPRLITDAIPKDYFGFVGQSNSGGFGRYPFSDISDDGHSDLVLSDDNYRLLLRAKIAKNTADAKVSGEGSIQDLLKFIFGREGYVRDNKDMTITMYVDLSSYNDVFVHARRLDLLPRPQAVAIREVVGYSRESFGFRRNDNSRGFSFGSFARRLKG